jgi:hypothetical protein
MLDPKEKQAILDAISQYLDTCEGVTIERELVETAPAGPWRNHRAGAIIIRSHADIAGTRHITQEE